MEPPPQGTPEDPVVVASEAAAMVRSASSGPPPPLVAVQECLRELRALRELGPHPQLVGLEGAVARPLCLVVERMDGSLADLLASEHFQQEPRSDGSDGGGSDALRLHLLLDVAAGLAHMHKLGFLHRDVKPHNILVRKASFDHCAHPHPHDIAPLKPIDDHVKALAAKTPAIRVSEGLRLGLSHHGIALCAKIGDLGTAVRVPQRENGASGRGRSELGMVFGCVGTSGYTAPEVLASATVVDTLIDERPGRGLERWGGDGGGGGYSFPADVFSFAVVTWEMFSGLRRDNPLQGLAPDQAVEQMADGIRPLFSDHHHPAVARELAAANWVFNPNNRMEFSAIQGLLLDAFSPPNHQR